MRKTYSSTKKEGERSTMDDSDSETAGDNFIYREGIGKNSWNHGSMTVARKGRKFLSETFSLWIKRKWHGLPFALTWARVNYAFLCF